MDLAMCIAVLHCIMDITSSIYKKGRRPTAKQNPADCRECETPLNPLSLLQMAMGSPFQKSREQTSSDIQVIEHQRIGQHQKAEFNGDQNDREWIDKVLYKRPWGDQRPAIATTHCAISMETKRGYSNNQGSWRRLRPHKLGNICNFG